jgi:hypothetical protein
MLSGFTYSNYDLSPAPDENLVKYDVSIMPCAVSHEAQHRIAANSADENVLISKA